MRYWVPLRSRILVPAKLVETWVYTLEPLSPASLQALYPMAPFKPLRRHRIMPIQIWWQHTTLLLLLQVPKILPVRISVGKPLPRVFINSPLRSGLPAIWYSMPAAIAMRYSSSRLAALLQRLVTPQLA